MVSDFEVLQEMIKDTAKLDIIHDQRKKSGKKKIDLTEPQHPNSKVTISGLPDNVIAIKADSFKSPDTILNGSRRECKRSDFIIIAEFDNNKKVILFIEMKAASKEEIEVVAQLTGSLCLISYVREIGKQFWKQKDFLKNYLYRFVSISHTNISKTNTRPPRVNRPNGKHDRPDKMLKIAYTGNLQFEDLVG